MPETNLTTEALERLGLEQQPFSAPGYCDELFRNTALDMLIKSVLQQLRNSQYIALIKGEAGIGKSCLCLRLLCEVDSTATITRINANDNTTIKDILAQLIADQDIVISELLSDSESEKKNRSEKKQALNQLLQQLQNGQQPVLLIDDAHLLDQQTLSALLKFSKSVHDAAYGGGLKLILVARREIDDLLDQLPKTLFDPQYLNSLLLRPLNRTEIKQYLQNRFQKAGSKQLPINKLLLRSAQNNCGGIPGKINQLICEQINNGENILSAFDINLKKALAAGVLLLIPIIFVVLVITGHDTGKPDAELEPAPIVPPLNHEPADILPPISTADSPTEDQPTNPAAEAQAPEGIDPFIQATEFTATEPLVEIRTEPELAEVNAEQVTPLNGIPDTSITEVENPAAPEEITVSQSGASELTDSTAINENTEVEVADSTHINKGKLVIISDTELAQYGDDAYVIQLAGAWNKTSLMNYGQKFMLDPPLIFFSSTRQQQPWHTLLYGPFPSYQAAQQAAATLPAELGSNKPWIRKVQRIIESGS